MKNLINNYLDWFNKGNKVLNLIITVFGLVLIVPLLIIVIVMKIVDFLRNNDSDATWVKYLKFALRLITFVFFFACCLINEIVKNSIELNPYNVKIMFAVAITYFFWIVPYFSCKIFRIYDSFKVAWIEQAFILLLIVLMFKYWALFWNDNPTDSNYFDVISWTCTFAGIVALIKL